MDFSIHVVILMGPIFHFPKSRIKGLLQYLHIIIVEEKVVIQLFCKQFVTWTNYFGMFVAWFLAKQQMGPNLRCHLFINNFEHNQCLKEPIEVVEGLKIKPYLLGDASYAN